MPNSNIPVRIAIVAGEASGDALAANLILALKQRYPQAEFVGIAGPKMQNAGCTSLFDIEQLSVMGLVEVLPRLRALLRLRSQLVDTLLEYQPDIYIGVDAPDFNLRIATALKAKGIKTVHYVSPSVWAWREKRIFKIAKATNLVLGIFPMDQAIYDKYQVPYRYVGHSMADEIPLQPDREAARATLKLEAGRPILALLPGSRAGEVKTLLPIFLKAAEKLAATLPELKVVIPLANKARQQQVSDYLLRQPAELDVQLVIGHSQQVMIAANAVLLASGTATLEAALCKRPMVVAYKLNWLTHQMMKGMYKPDYFALPNILAGRELVPELLQGDVEPQSIAERLLPMFNQPDEALQQALLSLHQQLKQGADQQAAEAISELLND